MVRKYQISEFSGIRRSKRPQGWQTSRRVLVQRIVTRASRVDNLTCCRFLSLVHNVVPFLGAVGAQPLPLSLAAGAAAMPYFEWSILHMAYLDKGCEWNLFGQHTDICLYLMIRDSIFREESFLSSFS